MTTKPTATEAGSPSATPTSYWPQTAACRHRPSDRHPKADLQLAVTGVSHRKNEATWHTLQIAIPMARLTRATADIVQAHVTQGVTSLLHAYVS